MSNLVATISGINVFKFDVEVLSHLSVAELETRLTKIEALAAKAKSDPIFGDDRGDPVIVHGRRVAGSRREQALDGLRHAWAATKVALNKRA